MVNDKCREYDCCICGEIDERRLSEPFRRVYEIVDRTCAETNDFIVFPSVSPLATGHMLIFPKCHVPSLRKLSVPSIKLLGTLAAEVATIVSSEDKRPFFFEHGVLEDGKGSCGITHAHLHVLPISLATARAVTQQASSRFPPQLAGTLASLLFGSRQIESPYLLFGENLEDIHLAFAASIPSQFMRRLIATSIGLPEWDWKQLTGDKIFRRTIERFGSTRLCSA